MSDVRLVVLNNGLQLVGVFEGKDEESHSIKLSSPVQLIIIPQGQDAAGKGNQVGMAFAPFLQYTEEWKSGLKFVVSDVLTVATPVRDLVNSYQQSFGTGLVLPPGVGSL
jgi:hypothetical protein